ncbi:MAG: winged helix-turn-helix transcriptional regulator [Nitrospirae bacterium]|nr:winged helix-turn-helix transcriptional regulator [Nitrospirota bacterium]
MKKASIETSVDWTVMLKALADETRLRIIKKLLGGEASVNRLANITGVEAYNISKHLKILETSGLIEKRKEGVQRIYRIPTSYINQQAKKENAAKTRD